MAAALYDFQSLTASDVAALAGRWPSVAAAVPASNLTHLTVNEPMPTARVIKHRTGIPGWPQEGSS